MSFLNNLNWRYATKQYSGQKVADADLEKIVEAIRFAPSSSGTQPYHVIVASGEMKDALITSSGQVAKLAASHLFVFCTRTDFPTRGEKQIAITAETQGVDPESLGGLKKTVWSTFEGKDPEQFRAWAARQTCIALGFGLAACAELKIDASPMEGFKPEEFHSILKLPDYIQPVALMGIGYRDPEDPAQPSRRTKMRFPKDDLFTFLS
jgi:nitroreductase/dihydropteridine reductase